MSAALVRLFCPRCGQRTAVRGQPTNVPRCHRCKCNLVHAQPPSEGTR